MGDPRCERGRGNRLRERSYGGCGGVEEKKTKTKVKEGSKRVSERGFWQQL